MVAWVKAHITNKEKSLRSHSSKQAALANEKLMTAEGKAQSDGAALSEVVAHDATNNWKIRAAIRYATEYQCQGGDSQWR